MALSFKATAAPSLFVAGQGPVQFSEQGSPLQIATRYRADRVHQLFGRCDGISTRLVDLHARRQNIHLNLTSRIKEIHVEEGFRDRSSARQKAVISQDQAIAIAEMVG